jgi:adenine-specific DNA-methyltransferase
MDDNKFSEEIFNVPKGNMAKLAALFPGVLKDGQLDIAALREELGDFEEAGPEKFELNWAGKAAAKKLSQTDVYGRTLKFVPKDSKDADSTQNLYIEGDNLEVLKLLRRNYYGAVKMIYIDPPYNTGGDFVYCDNFTQSRAQSSEAEGETMEGRRMVVNQKSGNRFHANWLNMIYPRLRVARDLLREDGVIFISIDDNEQDNLKKICSEIFGEDNFLGQFVINSTPNGRDYGHVGKMHEYALFYAKNSLVTATNLLPEKDKAFKYSDETGGYNIHPLHNSNEAFTNLNRPNLFYPFYLYLDEPLGEEFYRIGLEKRGNCAEILPPKSVKNGVQFVWRWGKDKARANLSTEIVGHKTSAGKYRIVQKMRQSEKIIRSLLLDAKYSSRRGTAEVEEILSGKHFSFPKPLALLKDFVKIATTDDDIVLDFFSGSATTAHAVMEINAADGGRRKFIMVQYPEDLRRNNSSPYKNICEIGKKRIRLAGEKIIENIAGGAAANEFLPDIGFKVFRTADTNIRWIHEALKDGESFDYYKSAFADKDALDFMPHYTDIDVVYEILLRQRDIPLSAKVERPDMGGRIYMFGGGYIVCLENEITAELIEALAAISPAPIKYVLRDSAFEDDISFKDETIQLLEAYTVEFI